MYEKFVDVEQIPQEFLENVTYRSCVLSCGNHIFLFLV